MKQGILVPEEIFNLKSKYPEREINDICQFHNIVNNKLRKRNLTKKDFVGVPYQNFDSKIENYSKTKRLAYKNQIYETGGLISDGQCQQYKLLTGPETHIVEIGKKGKKHMKQKRPKQKFVKNTSHFLENLELDYKVAMNYIYSYTENLKLSDLFNINENIPFKAVELANASKFRNRDSKGRKKQFDKNYLIEQARKDGKSLIQVFGKECIIANAKEFEQAKKEDLQNEYWQTLELFRHGYWNIIQSKSNNRLFHVLTSLKSGLWPFFTYKGEPLKEIDLGNSQFTILSGIINGELRLNKTDWQQPNIKEWDQNSLRLLDAARESEFYETIQSELKLDSREQAKNRSYEIIFSHFTSDNKDKEQLRETFPALLEYCESFKKLNCKIGKKFHPSTLPVSLQLKESDLFLGPIYREAEKRKIPFITKHDSILYPANKNLNPDVLKKYIKGEFSEKVLGNF